MSGGSLLFALSLSLAVVGGNPSTEQPLGRLTKFIGEQVSFDPIDCIPYRWGTAVVPDDDGDSNVQDEESAPCNEDDLHYKARYRVLQAIEGSAGETVEFHASGWTSYYAEGRHAVLYVLESPDGMLLPAGLAISVYPTVDGDWASCDAEAGSEPLKFAGDIVFGRTDGMSPYGIAQRYPSSDYIISGKEAFCIRGRRLPALLEELKRELEDLRERGFPHLPNAKGNRGQSLRFPHESGLPDKNLRRR